MEPDVFIGLDVHKSSITIAIASAGRLGEVRRYGTTTHSPEAVAKLVRKLSKLHQSPECIYEAGPCGYVLFWQLTILGVDCKIVAPGHLRYGIDDVSNSATSTEDPKSKREHHRALTDDRAFDHLNISVGAM